MLLSSYVLQNSFENYKKSRENYSIGETVGAGASAAVVSFMLVVAVLFFLMELLLIFYGLKMAIFCTNGGAERIVNVVLVVLLPLPYVMLNILFNKCAQKSLRSE